MAENVDPLVSVLLPSYNAGKYLSSSIKSILTQTYNNFELIIIDDASIDNTEEIVFNFRDDRIRYFKNHKNLGVVNSLNKAISLAEGKYLLRMDADDISLRNRIEIQISYLEKNPDVGVLGTNLKCFGKNNDIWRNPVSFEEIKIKLFFDSPLWHPTVAIRKSVLVNNNIYYDLDYEHCEDYKMWYDLSKVSIIRNIDKILLLYRIHDNNHSRNQPNLKKLRMQIYSESIFNRNHQIYDPDLHNLLMSYHGDIINEKLLEIKKWLYTLKEENKRLNYFPQILFEKYIKQKFRHCLIRNYYTNLHNSGGYKSKNIKYFFDVFITMFFFHSVSQTLKEFFKFIIPFFKIKNN